VRARLLALGITVTAVATEAGASVTMTSHVLTLRRGSTSPIAARIVAAAERLSGAPWADLTAPDSPRQPRRRAA
jgi:hypothetical protein